jgi:hypothetical protein
VDGVVLFQKGTQLLLGKSCSFLCGFLEKPGGQSVCFGAEAFLVVVVPAELGDPMGKEFQFILR